MLLDKGYFTVSLRAEDSKLSICCKINFEPFALKKYTNYPFKGQIESRAFSDACGSTCGCDSLLIRLDLYPVFGGIRIRFFLRVISVCIFFLEGRIGIRTFSTRVLSSGKEYGWSGEVGCLEVLSPRNYTRNWQEP